MAGPQYTKTCRSSSSSPKLKCNSTSKIKSKGSAQQGGPSEILKRRSPKPKSFTPEKCSSPVNSKRRINLVSSPISSQTVHASRSATSSPIAPKSVAPNKILEKVLLEGDADVSESSAGVPKVAALPPEPSFLPTPPMHWIEQKDSECQASKQQCRVVTQCLMSHLSSTGILISAQ